MNNLVDIKTSQRNISNKKESVDIDHEVQKLFKRTDGKMDQREFQNLRNKFGDIDMVSKIETVFINKHIEITKRAKKFAQLIREKYSNNQYPFHILLEKAYKYKIKHGITDAEFTEFQRIYENELIGLKSPDVYQPSTNISKLLGHMNVNLQGFSGKLSDSDYKVLQEVLKLYATSKPLHAQVVLQSMQYKDCDIISLTGEYDKKSHIVSNHIHPVIAALFIPKINILEDHFLKSNISNIVRCRYNNENFTSREDISLFWALSHDPNDIVCNNTSTLADLHTRALIQTQLWNAVLSLRNGQYYNSTFKEFITNIDMCRLNKQDTPDLIYGRYDGTIIKRLLSTFSFKPTVVATMPSYQHINMNPYQQNIKPVVTYIPMINFMVPPSLTSNEPLNLNDALEQEQFFIINGTVVPRHTSLIYSRDVLFFFIDRRATVIKTFNTFDPFSVANFPLSSLGFETINDREINYKPSFTIRKDEYHLRSVVLCELNKSTNANEKIVVGSSTCIVHLPCETNGYETFYYHYDPYNVINITRENNNLLSPNPIEQIPETPGPDNNKSSFEYMVRTRGIIFMYQLINNKSNGDILLNE